MSSSRGVGARFIEPGAREFILLGFISLAWGTSYMFTKVAIAELPPLTLVTIRVAIAALVMLGVQSVRGGWPRLSLRDLSAFAFVGLVAIALPLCLIAVSVSYVDSSVPAVTMALVPLITACFGILQNEYPDWRTVAGILVGLAGILVLFGPDAFTSFGASARGLLAAGGAAVLFSASLFSMALVRRHNSLAVATILLVFAALWMFPIALVVDGGLPHWPSHIAIGAILALAVFNTAAANLMLFTLVARAGPAFTSYNNYLVPAVAVVCGVLVLGEALTLRAATGVVLVLAGVAISTLRRRS
jgi:drug/metabolite transporter (DMT)-like permease